MQGATAGAALALSGVGPAGAQGTPGAKGPENPPEELVYGPQQTFPLTDKKETISVLAVARPEVQDFKTNEFTHWLEERTGVHVEWNILPRSDDTAAAFNVRLASGDYPDVILGLPDATAAGIQVYGQQGVYVPLNDLIDKYGVYTKQVFEIYPEAKKAVTGADGKIYALPQVNDCFHCSLAGKLWVNKPWLDELGLKIPETTDDYAALLKAFKEKDPNKDGKADELPLTGSNMAWNGELDMFFLNSFTMNTSGDTGKLVVKDGKVTAAFVEDGWREGIKFLAGLTKDGLLDPQIFTRDTDQLNAIGNAQPAVAGTVPAGWWGVFTNYTMEQDGPWQQYTTAIPPLKGPDGTRHAWYDPYAAIALGSFLITNKCKNPELAFKWADSLAEIEATVRSIQGVKDRDWRWALPGEVGINGKQALWKSITNIANVSTQNVHWGQLGPSFRTNDMRLGEAIDPKDAPRHVEVILYNETKEKYQPYALPKDAVLPPLYFSEQESQQIVDMSKTIYDYVDQTFAQGVTGQIDIEAEWDNYKQTLDSMGLQDYLKLNQDVYDKQSGQ